MAHRVMSFIFILTKPFGVLIFPLICQSNFSHLLFFKETHPLLLAATKFQSFCFLQAAIPQHSLSLQNSRVHSVAHRHSQQSSRVCESAVIYWLLTCHNVKVVSLFLNHTRTLVLCQYCCMFDLFPVSVMPKLGICHSISFHGKSLPHSRDTQTMGIITQE